MPYSDPRDAAAAQRRYRQRLKERKAHQKQAQRAIEGQQSVIPLSRDPVIPRNTSHLYLFSKKARFTRRVQKREKVSARCLKPSSTCSSRSPPGSGLLRCAPSVTIAAFHHPAHGAAIVRERKDEMPHAADIRAWPTPPASTSLAGAGGPNWGFPPPTQTPH